MKLIRDWFHETFSDRQVLILTVILLIAVAGIVFIADMLAPLIAAFIIAFMLDGPVRWLTRRNVSHIVAVNVVFVGFFLAALLFLLGLLPVLFRQMGQFVARVPEMTQELQSHLVALPQRYPDMISEDQISGFIREIGSTIVATVSALPSFAGASVVGLLTAIVYLILVLVLVFFMIKDKRAIVTWLVTFLPRDRELTSTVWSEITAQVYNYMRGKVWEILIVGVVTYVVFALLGVEFSILLAVITGLSVLIPYVGAAAVTVPVAVIAFLQYGMTWNFGYVVIAYGIIQALDGNILAPLLFSEVVNLHPVAIIVAILIFGGLWGLWGVFFAIPLATVVQAVLRAWPRTTPWRRVD
ncbi:MAG: AI-2E family transporter [bacterium]|nr:AI-2E family transporter [bacterium]MDE0417232.1 AI-2E family transporter [bacterium]